MKRLLYITIILVVVFVISPITAGAKKEYDGNDDNSLISSIKFDDDLIDDVNHEKLVPNGDYSYVDGVLPDTKALHLEDGDNNYISAEHQLEFDEDNFTVSFWYKGDTKEDQVILSNKDFDESSEEGWAIYTSDNSINMNLGFSSEEEQSVEFGRDTFDASDWRYVTFVVDRNEMLGSLYVDGYKMTEATLHHGNLDTSNPLNIGSDGLGNFGENSFDIADLEISEEALSTEEIKNNFTSYDIDNVDLDALNEEISEAKSIVEKGKKNGFSDTDFDYLQETLNMSEEIASTQDEKLFTQETINYYERELSNAIFIYQKSNKDDTPADLNMIVNSDTEITDSSKEIDRVENVFRESLATFPQADVMYVPGDVTGGNNPEEYKYMDDLTNVYNDLEDEGLFDDVEFYLARGNHDMPGAEDLIPEGSAGLWNDSTDSYDNKFYNDAYRVDLNGYDLVVFDGMIDNEKPAEKTKELLEEIQNEPDYDPNKPIFVSSHFPVEDTVWGSDYSSEASNDVGEYINDNDLSQVVYLGGHSHYDPTDERSLYQDKATYVESGSTAYSSYIDPGPYGEYIEGDYIEYSTEPQISNFIEIYGTKMIIKRYNVNTEEFVGIPSVVNVGDGEDAFTYSKDDTKELIAPQFDEDITIDSLEDDELTFTMKQAEDNVNVLEYNVELINELTGEVEESFNSLSLPMDDPYETYKDYTLSDVSSDTPYKLRVFANDSMYNRSSQDIEINADVISSSSMIDKVDYFKEEEEITDEDAAHALNIHLTSVEHFEKIESGEKVVKHMKNLKLLIEQQKEDELISDKAFNTLNNHADYVIKHWK